MISQQEDLHIFCLHIRLTYQVMGTKEQFQE